MPELVIGIRVFVCWHFCIWSLLHLRPHLKAGNFILWFADNICAVDAASMLHTLKMTKTLACVAMRSSRKEETGFADVEGDIVKRFVE